MVVWRTSTGARRIHGDGPPSGLHRGLKSLYPPYTDRLNYVSPLLNNFGYALAVEKLLEIEVPERCNWIRTLMGEMSRITDHLTAIGASALTANRVLRLGL